MGKYYPQSKLVEINTHSLGSKFFGESGKLVSKVFDNIATLLEEEEDTFVCVFVDEIETIAARRERVLSGNEPFDAVRAVNALLTGLDRLRNYPNVVIICTSNLVTALVRLMLRLQYQFTYTQLLIRKPSRTKPSWTGWMSSNSCRTSPTGPSMEYTRTV